MSRQLVGNIRPDWGVERVDLHGHFGHARRRLQPYNRIMFLSALFSSLHPHVAARTPSPSSAICLSKQRHLINGLPLLRSSRLSYTPSQGGKDELALLSLSAATLTGSDHDERTPVPFETSITAADWQLLAQLLGVTAWTLQALLFARTTT